MNLIGAQEMNEQDAKPPFYVGPYCENLDDKNRQVWLFL